MFTAELKVNGALIAVLYGHNESQKDGKGRDLYTYSYHELNKTEVKHGSYWYNRGEGLTKLVADILKKVE